jgi:type III pantothenate kinase
LSAALALPQERRIGLAQVPLQQLPPWLGVDRALVGWRAWRCQAQAVLVADAGTCLSLTCVDGQGRFRGGRLSAGLALQLRSLGLATAQLPDLPEPLPVLSRAAALQSSPSASDWPVETTDAMVQGCLRACAAAVAQAWRERCSVGESWALWLTGGDATLLEPLLRQQGIASVLAPDLALEALAELAEGKGFSPDPGR